MSSHPGSGSALKQEVIELKPVFGPEGKPPANHFEPKALGTGSFSTTYQWRGHGAVRLNLQSGWIGAGSRVVASISEYNTSWNVDRFLGDATMQVLNVAPYKGGAWVDVSVAWSGPLNVCITLFVDP
jgi:hypothetical protein